MQAVLPRSSPFCDRTRTQRAASDNVFLILATHERAVPGAVAMSDPTANVTSAPSTDLLVLPVVLVLVPRLVLCTIHAVKTKTIEQVRDLLTCLLDSRLVGAPASHADVIAVTAVQWVVVEVAEAVEQHIDRHLSTVFLDGPGIEAPQCTLIALDSLGCALACSIEATVDDLP